MALRPAATLQVEALRAELGDLSVVRLWQRAQLLGVPEGAARGYYTFGPIWLWNIYFE
jgi:hypothetical protein